VPTCIKLQSEGKDKEAVISFQDQKLHETIVDDERPIIYIVGKTYSSFLSSYLHVVFNPVKYSCKQDGHLHHKFIMSSII
jgi:hypothetical protein